ncbi:PQQ-binding-like beta-propeller repeat protein [Mycobacterium sp. GA-2829]|uniref:Rv3212 family protein n=1 Tax=Mycobacterium sp. GA-2829 TaxID=1772283 RepID=UPI00074026BC|nr:PQQ-binding-like beta-propeller repeat protein [Mycobacterium sp. GA-2829]KUI36430.1 hypothetical protein AU194_08020 [Mycobacterium sp. GA-2829]
MVKPERRTRGDVMAAVAIAAVIALVAAVVWWTSDARATISEPAASAVPDPKPAAAVPSALREVWSAPSPKTRLPVVVGGSVVTGDGDTVVGRDPATGDTVWRYARGIDLCGVTSVYHYAVAVYPDARGCGQVSTINGRTGKRGNARSGYADREVTLSSDGTTVLSAGDSRLELWRSDMVRMLSYGALDARVKPDVPIAPLCRLTSAAASSEAVSVLEACPNEDTLRLTLLRPSNEEDTPDIKYVELSDVAADSDARVIAVSDSTTAVYLPTPEPTVDIVDETGTTVASTLMTAPPSPHAVATRAGDLITWWTGDSVMVFSASGLQYKYTVTPSGGNMPLGPAAEMADRLLVPVTDGYDVFDPGSGAGERHIALTRTAVDGAVIPAVVGDRVVELRGGELIGLG